MFRCYIRPFPLSIKTLAIREAKKPLIQAVQFSSRPPWSDEEIEALLKAYKEYLRPPNFALNDNQIWRKISALLEEEGVHRLASQCKSKWRRLRVTYEAAKETGTESSLPHHEKIGQLLQLQRFDIHNNFREKSDTIELLYLPKQESEDKTLMPGPSENLPDEHTSKEAEKPQSPSSHASVPAVDRSLPSPPVRCSERSSAPPESDVLTHKLVELLRSQLEFQNLIYRNIIEEFHKSRREEHQLRSEILLALKEINLAKAQNSNSTLTSDQNKPRGNSPLHQASIPQPSPFISDQSSDGGIDVFEADENLRALKENLNHTNIPYHNTS